MLELGSWGGDRVIKMREAAVIQVALGASD